MKKSAFERFAEKTIINRQTGCWEWTGYLTGTGYAGFNADGGQIAARWSYRFFNGEITNGKEVCHTCDNPLCVNPTHLFLGTHHENMLDKMAKGRGRHISGKDHYKAKINETQVREIRSRWENGESLEEIAKDFPICWQNIRRVAKRETWKHVSD